MRSIALLLALLAAAPALAQAPGPANRRTGSGASTYEVRRVEHGTLVLTARNLRFDPYAVIVNDRFVAHLLTVVTTTSARTEAEGGDGRVAVTVDDLSGPAPRRLATFSDPGDEGVRHGNRHFVTTGRGCCASPTVHRVRRLPDGRLLFRATGPGPVGTSAFLQASSGALALRRWAAYDGDVEEAQRTPGLLGTLAWGDADGAIQRLRLRHTGPSDDASTAEMALAHGARMVWAEPDHPPAAGTIELPTPMWAVQAERGAEGIGGFSVRLLDEAAKVIAEIPVEANRLVPERATLAPGYALDAVPPPAPGRPAPRPAR